MRLDRDAKRVLVAGLGVSGEAAARVLLALGHHVTVTDDTDDERQRERASRLPGANVVLGNDGSEAARACEILIASPGLRPSAPVFAAAREAGVPVWSEVELAYRLAIRPILGVTGTNGKTTTTQMIAAALGEAGYRVVAAGNIGFPLVDAVLQDHDVIVAELSSFQLHFTHEFHAPVAVLLNIADDHLDWHGSFEAYAVAKARIFDRQVKGDVAVHFDDELCATAADVGAGRRVPFSPAYVPPAGAGVEDGWIVAPEGRVVEVPSLRVRGRAMLANAVAAAAAACAFGADPERVGSALAAFEPQAHRMEPVATAGGITYVNDSKATNPHATLAALEGLHNVVLIAGGRNKGLDLGTLARATYSVKAVVAIGESASDVVAAFAGTPAERAATMDDAVERAAAVARPGDTVLLSPACASFDMFTDYRARGEAFRAAVKRIAARGGDDG